MKKKIVLPDSEVRAFACPAGVVQRRCVIRPQSSLTTLLWGVACASVSAAVESKYWNGLRCEFHTTV